MLQRPTTHKAVALATAFMLALSGFACDSTGSDPTPPEIQSDMLQVEGGRGTRVTIPLTLQAEAGVKSLVITDHEGAETQIDITAAGIINGVFSYTYAFDIPPESTVGTEYNLTFTVTDENDGTSSVLAVVTTGNLIEAPATYDFERQGQTTVSYSGQNERLDQLEEIKGYLQTGDAGSVLSEQALLDMFANTGDNGAGNFSFSSTKQLKDKTFAPDLDSQLFEQLFADAARASLAGNNGVTAANGTAGLIVRESNGQTVLVDENGREFTQMIEKGLMGAVFYNQIYNTYLTDDRIGTGVENVLLADGKNYTPMEHHWDEAFGYWNPPVDFSSNWPADRAGEDRFWSHYSNTVDNVRDGLLGTNSAIMNAFITGRTAIVNNDPTVKNAQRDILYEQLELVAAGVAVHYLNNALRHLGDGETGDAFHVLSEVWAFTNALRYSPGRAMSLDAVDEILAVDLGANGNFWNATPLGLNMAKSKLVTAYPALASVQDDL